MAEAQAPAALGDFGVLLGGAEVGTGNVFEVHSPYARSLVAVVHNAGPAEIERAIAGAAGAFTTTRALPSWKRSAILEAVAAALLERREEFARTIALEAGKPIRTARLEVDRASFTFKVGAEEARRIPGEIL